MYPRPPDLLSLEEKDRAVAEVKVYEVLGFVSYEAAKVTANNAVPGRALSLVKRSLDVLCNVLLNRILRHGLLSDFYTLLLHIIRHVCGFDLRLELLPRRRNLCRLVRHVV